MRIVAWGLTGLGTRESPCRQVARDESGQLFVRDENNELVLATRFRVRTTPRNISQRETIWGTWFVSPKGTPMTQRQEDAWEGTEQEAWDVAEPHIERDRADVTVEVVL